MKEFNSWFTISFSYLGKDIEQTISLSQIERINVRYDIWVYRFDVPIKDDIVTIEVYGTIDDDDNIRTSGPSIINGVEMPSVFGINVLDEYNEVIDEIDDIDIIDCD